MMRGKPRHCKISASRRLATAAALFVAGVFLFSSPSSPAAPGDPPGDGTRVTTILPTPGKALIAFDGTNYDRFGTSVAVDGDVMVVGAYRADVGTNINAGAAYVFERNAGGTNAWGMVRKLVAASDAHAYDEFGAAVSVAGDVIVVGAPEDDIGAEYTQGSAYVFERNAGGTNAWGQVRKLVAASGVGGDEFGNAVSVSGDIIAVGAFHHDGTYVDEGRAFVFERNHGGTNAWGEVTSLSDPYKEKDLLFGGSVSVWGDVLAVGVPGTQSGRGRVYVYERSVPGRSNLWSLVHSILADDGDANDRLGSSVAVVGDVLVAGAPTLGTWGAAYVFERNAGAVNAWTQVGKLRPSDSFPLDLFGGAVAAWGDLVLVGAQGMDSKRGSAYLFERHAGGTNRWAQVAEVAAAVRSTNDYFGCSVALAADLVAAGAYGDDTERGSAHVFLRRMADWRQIKRVSASDGTTTDQFGISLSVDGDVLGVGARYHDGTKGADQGAAYVYERNDGGTNAWGQVGQLLASDGASNDFFGCSIAVAGDVIAVGAYGENSLRGAAYVYERNDDGTNAWGQVRKLVASDAAVDDWFGCAVGADGDVIAVGASRENSSRGAAYVFERNQGGTNAWGEVRKVTASTRVAGDEFGTAVAVAGDIMVVGASAADTNRGAAYVFERNQGGTNAWGQVRKLLASDGATNDRFGFSVAADGDVVAVGAYGDASARGAAYVFERNQGGTNAWGQVRKLTADDGTNSDYFGFGVAVAGGVILAGAQGDNSSRGSVYAYERNVGGTNAWGQTRKIVASGVAIGDNFGCAVAAAGSLFAAGAYLDNVTFTDQGSAYVFEGRFVPDLTTADVSLTEPDAGTTNVLFTVSLTATAIVDVAVTWTTSNGTAVAGSDYVATSGVLRISTGSATGAVTVVVRGDTLYEANEDFYVNFSSPSNVSLAEAQARGTILNDDPPPSLSIGDSPNWESSTPVTFPFTVSLSATSALVTAVSYSTSNGTAFAGVDYTATSGVITIAAGASNATINVNVKGDTLHENDETFWVLLSGPSNAVLGDGMGLGTIQDDDPPPTVRIADAWAMEGSNLIFTVSLNVTSSLPASVSFATTNGTAVAGADYDARTGVLTFAEGTLSQTLVVTTRQDAIYENTESFQVVLSAPVDCTISDGTATGTITNDDPLPSLSIVDTRGWEGNASTTAFTFRISLSAPSGLGAQVTWATSNGTALAGSDYTTASGTLIIPAGSTNTNAVVFVLGDTVREPDETFYVALSSPVNATILDGMALGVISNDDLALPSLSVSDASIREGHYGTSNLVFNISLSALSGYTVAFAYATSNGSALAGSDYTAVAGPGTIPPGSQIVSVSVPVNGDCVAEPNETCYLIVSNAVEATIADGQAVGTILNDDLASAITALTVAGSNVVAQWSATSGVRYTVQAATNLLGASVWGNLAPSNMTGPTAPPWTLRLTNVVGPPSALPHFYRVQITAP